MAVLIPVAPTPPHQELLMLEQRRRRAAEPCAPLGADDRVVYRDLEVPADDQVAYQCQIQLAGCGLAQRLHLGCEPEIDQRHICGIRHIYFINALFIIGRHIQIPVPHSL